MKTPLSSLAAWIVAGLLMLPTQPAVAGVEYFASVDVGGPPSDSHSGTDPVTASLSFAGGLISGQSSAGGSLGTRAEVSTLGLPPGPGLIRSEAAFVASDAIVRGAGSSLSVPLSLFLDGTLQVLLASNPAGTDWGHYSGGSRLIVDIWIDPISGAPYRAGHGQREVGVGQIGTAPPEDARSSEGFLGAAGWTSSFGRDSISGLVTTEALTLPVNEAFSFQINLSSIAFASVASPYEGPTLTMTAIATSDFLHTLGFLSDSPVLLLPQGYTFDAPSLGIVDNRCTGPLCVTAPVSEPPAVVMLVAGLLLTLALTRRRTEGARS